MYLAIGCIVFASARDREDPSIKIYQCIHKYAPHIPAFEKRWQIGSSSSFADIHAALIADGYASVYRLDPSAAHSADQVFFTVWNYERLQYAWASENGLKTRDLDEIRLAQIEAFNPDVIYDFSSFVSSSFAGRAAKRVNSKIVCWNGFIKEPTPPVDPAYDGYVSLHRPFVESWQQRGFPALELQPGLPAEWAGAPVSSIEDRPLDLMLYGLLSSVHKDRRQLVDDVVERSARAGISFYCFAHGADIYYRPGGRLARYGIRLPFLIRWPKAATRERILSPVYGADLTEKIRNSKAALNNFGDLNRAFQSNMRIFEVVGNATPLISSRGNYPEGLYDGVDYLGFSSTDEIIEHCKWIKREPEAATEFANNARTRMNKNFSKDRQYEQFVDFIGSL